MVTDRTGYKYGGPPPSDVSPGDALYVFNAEAWKRGGYDDPKTDNRQYFHKALILDVSGDAATIWFIKEKRVSHGHFLSATLTDIDPN